ncbi:MAG TPA: response regulator transcription factor [Kofleriaceae bacterium]|nr:response regulator transcription factor [Kofleriaceae bacterium]
MAKRLLLVEDEPDVARLVVYNLEAAGWTVTHAARGLDALARARVEDPVVVILDVMLPDMSGFDVCKRLRATAETADVGIMMLTARGDADDRITGLEVGADDYVTKPFVVREVILRVAALANRIAERKARAPAPGPGETITLGPLTIDTAAHEVVLEGAALALRPLEYKLLLTLAVAPGRVFTREDLLAEVWDIRGSVSTRTVDVHVRRLRVSLGAAADWIETVHGFGYRAKRADGGGDEVPPATS